MFFMLAKLQYEYGKMEVSMSRDTSIKITQDSIDIQSQLDDEKLWDESSATFKSETHDDASPKHKSLVLSMENLFDDIDAIIVNSVYNTNRDLE